MIRFGEAALNHARLLGRGGALDEDAPQHQGQGLALAAQVDHGGKPVVPVGHHGEHRLDGQDGHGQGDNHADKGAELGRAVDLSRLHQVVGNAVLEVVAHDDHIAHPHAAGEKQGPHTANQVGLLDNQVGGDHAAAEVHGDDEKDIEELPSRQILLGQGVGGDVQHHHGENGADDGVLHRVEEARHDLRVGKHRLIAVQGKAAGQQERFARVHVIGV